MEYPIERKTLKSFYSKSSFFELECYNSHPTNSTDEIFFVYFYFIKKSKIGSTQRLQPILRRCPLQLFNRQMLGVLHIFLYLQ
jgi:hypothetical protein